MKTDRAIAPTFFAVAVTAYASSVVVILSLRFETSRPLFYRHWRRIESPKLRLPEGLKVRGTFNLLYEMATYPLGVMGHFLLLAGEGQVVGFLFVDVFFYSANFKKLTLT